jgi:hypothetical protein
MSKLDAADAHECLTPRLRRLTTLRSLGYTDPEIAEIEGVDDPQVITQALYRSRKASRKRADKEGRTYD